MTTKQLSFERQVVEMPCPTCCEGQVMAFINDGEKGYAKCDACQGTWLRWPTLSRRCIKHWWDLPPCSECGQANVERGRAPDVTLAKVAIIVLAETGAGLHFYPSDYIEGAIVAYLESMDLEFVSEDITEAACMALLETL